MFDESVAAATDPKLSTAITRLEDAYSRTKDEDRLIDYWVALESLFLPEKQTRDMSEAVALAISYYIGRTDADRLAIYNDIIYSHQLRSRIIHGKPREQRGLEEMVTKTREHLRYALRQRIEE